MSEENTICYWYDKDTKMYTINSKEMQKINRKLKERLTLKQENNQLKNDNAVMKANLIQVSDRQRDLYKEVIEEVRECLTGYSSIHTIQFGTEEDSPSDIELNKTLDEKTITEMTHRYLKVHDKLLQILDKTTKENK